MIGKKDRLRIDVKGGKLIISVGIDTLARAFEDSEYNEHFNDLSEIYEKLYCVTDHKEFAKEVALALQEEDEEGTTAVHVLLDEACENAIENGCEGVEEVVDMQQITKYHNEL